MSVLSTRNNERTRRALLDAATSVIAERGTGFSLDDVAKVAGMSKGGLMHHFSSRDALLAALADDALGQIRAQVLEFVDLSENVPGKLLRAYVRALCGGSPEAMQSFIASPLWNGFQLDAETAARFHADGARWKQEFTSDGIDLTHASLIMRAAEGFAAAHFYGHETSEALAVARERLLEMTLAPPR